MERPLAIEGLLEHAGWLRRLAAGLVQDGASADDLVQETWVAALRHPPEPERPARPWLARVARNLARNARRADERRSTREWLAHSEPSRATPDAAAQEAEIQHLLAGAVTELAEPLRTVVVLHYFRGQELAAIARELGVPASTVRSRLAQALEDLRGRLDRSLEGGRRAWGLVLGKLARREPGPVAASVPSASLLAAATLATGLALATAVYVLRDGRQGDERGSALVARESVLPSGPSAPRVAPPAEVGRAPLGTTAKTSGAVSAHETAAWLAELDALLAVSGTVLVGGEPPGRPLTLELRFAGIDEAEIGLTATTDDTGHFLVPGVEAGWRGSIQCYEHELEDSAPLEFVTPARDLVVRLRARPALTGRVVSPALEPVPDARGSHCLNLFVNGELVHSAVLELQCDGEGSFTIPIEAVANAEVEATLEFEVPYVGRQRLEVPRFARGNGRDIGDVVLERVWSMEFHVVDARGEPISAAVARIDDSLNGRPSDPTNREGRGKLRYVPERPTGVHFSALRYSDRVLEVSPGERPLVVLEPCAALEIALAPPAGWDGDFPDLWLTGERIGFRQEDLGATAPHSLERRNVQGLSWLEAGFQPDRGGHVLIVGLEPELPLRLELRYPGGPVLAARELTLGAGEWRRIEIPFEP